MLISMIMLLFLVQPAMAAGGAPREMLEVAQTWLDRGKQFGGPAPKDQMASIELGPAMRWYVTKSKDIENANVKTPLSQVFHPVGWMVVMQDSAGQSVGTITLAQKKDGTWSMLDMAYGGTKSNDINEAIKTIPGRAAAKSMDVGHLELGYVQFAHTQLIMARDGQQERAQAMSSSPGAWGADDLHSSQETLEQLKMIVKNSANGYGGEGGGAARNHSLWLWLAGGAVAALAALVALRKWQHVHARGHLNQG